MVLEKERIYNVKLPVFEGPFDLLLHLIKENEINIYDIPILQITAQYLEYIELMKELNLDVAGEFIVMAATLTHIKSKMLLPKPDPPLPEDEGDDPREELIKQLIEYKGFKDVTGFFRDQESIRENIFPACPDISTSEDDEPLVDLDIFVLLDAFKSVLQNTGHSKSYDVDLGDISVTEKLNYIMDSLARKSQLNFSEFFARHKSSRELVATFLALLELVRLKLVNVLQSSSEEPIVIIKAADNTDRRGVDGEGQDKGDN